jgi:hypothetical protein
MRFPSVVIGYHGCDQDVAESILAGKEEVRSSTNTYDWLGSGAYFWENNPARALSWATLLAKSNSRKIRNPAVIGAIIDPGNCLDLAEESSLKLVKAAFEIFSVISHISDLPLPVNEPGYKGDLDLVKRHLDCAVLNFLHDSRADEGLADYHTVRAPFSEGGELFKGSKLMDKTHVQWCVREPKHSIIAYFRPRDPKATEV